MKIKFHRVKFRAAGVMGQITTEIAADSNADSTADSTTQVKQIVSNLYDGAYHLQIVGPLYR